MMVLRHIGPLSCKIVSREDEEDIAAPIDLSKKHVPIEVPHRHSSNHNKAAPYISIVPSVAHAQSRNLNILRNTEQNNNRLCAISASTSAPNGDVRWREVSLVQPNDEDNNSYSSPDSGLQRDSPGEDDEQAGHSATPPLRSRRQNLIPLSLIRARYHQNHRTSESSNNGQDEDCSSTKPRNAVDQVKTKRARLEEMVSHIKQVNPKKPRSQRLSGDEDTSSGDHGTSSDEVADDSPTDLRSTAYRGEDNGENRDILTMPHNIFRVQHNEGDEPCNLTFRNTGSESPMQEVLNPMDLWRGKVPVNMKSLSPAEAAKMCGIDPDTYQQQIMQLQLTSAAMMGDAGGLLKVIGNYPPWVYLGYYSQLIQNFQAQEFIRQYAMQSQSATTPTIVTPGDKSPSVPGGTTLVSSGFACQSPASPTSLSEGPTGMDSDGSIVGQSTPGSANGKRAPRAMTGRHVRTGTGASPSTLQTLREKIEERQRLKAQQTQGVAMPQQSPSSKGKQSTNCSSFSLNNNNVNINNNNKPARKSRK